MTLKQLQLSAVLASVAACTGSGGTGKVDLATDDQKTFYALGNSMGKNLAGAGSLNNLAPSDVEAIKAGLGDALSNRSPQVDMPTYGPKIAQMMQARQAQVSPADAAKAADEKQKGTAFAETAAKEPGAEKLPSGLIYKPITPGTGASPAATDTVKVNYEGKLIDGTVFDASEKHGGAAEFPLNRVIPCWTEGVQKMKVGGKAQLVCPSTIAYGDQGHPPVIPGGATLVFTVELLEAKSGPPAGAPGMMGQRPVSPGQRPGMVPPGMGSRPPGMMPHPGGAMMGGPHPITVQPGSGSATTPPPSGAPAQTP